ncbi:hypothetical protein KUTG_04312 [Kutzneria sp. 744]|nr:hypothetical protein KUTG_04312 [Kutzneria sp. 744]
MSALTMAAVLAVSMVPAAQATPSMAGDAQLVAVEGNTLAHTIRYANGDWQRFGHLDAATVGSPTSVFIKGEEHLFFTTSTALEHYVRHVDGTWDLAASVPTVTADELGAVNVTSLDGRLALIRQVDRSSAWLSTQLADGTWSAWETAPLGDLPIRGLTVTSNGGTLRLVGVVDDDKNIMLVNRSPEGVWSSPTYRTLGVLGTSLGIGARASRRSAPTST